MIERRAGAPRLIDWTGERCVPWAPDVQVVYEHLHRYLWAAPLVAGREVLDLACGEGFGPAILSRHAASVTGIDIDERTVEHARLNYGTDRLRFEVGDARDLSRFAAGTFGAVVAYEMIEHLAEQAQVLAEIRRVLAGDGLLIISTPERHAYRAEESENPFHVRELNLEEFRELLGAEFAHVSFWGQHAIAGSLLAGAAERTGAQTLFARREGESWDSADGFTAMYHVALASPEELPAVAGTSVLADPDLAIVDVEAERRAAAARVEAEEFEQLREVAARAEAAQELGRRRLVDREIEIGILRDRVRELDAAAQAAEALQAELEATHRRLTQVEASLTWRAAERAKRGVAGALGGTESLAVRTAQRSLGAVARRRAAAKPAAVAAVAAAAVEVEFPQFPAPEVSLIIPVYAGAELTRACLHSILGHTSRISYEVIIVDDGEDPATKEMLSRVRGAQILTNEENIGYLRSVNRGAEAARGRWLVLCNNDIEVLENWLPELVACGEADENIAIVTPKYLYPDYSLMEAGGIIWRDGTGYNYGRGDSPGQPRYEYRRDVDYGSAAALLVRADFWREVGGYDLGFAPMYYEDTDLCFQARERGYRVVYEPRANVIHAEGSTAGTDMTKGFKRYQEINRERFVAKWRRQLESEHLGPGISNLRRGADRRTGLDVLIVDHRVPAPDRDSGSLRMQAMIDALLAAGCRVTFLPDDRHPAQPYTLELQHRGVEVWFGNMEIVEELAEIGPHLAMIIVSRPHVAARWLDLLRAQAPGVPILYDTVDLHYVREQRRAESEGRADALAHGSRAAALRELELAMLRAADASLVVTEAERERIRSELPGSVVRVVPNINRLHTPVPPRAGREGLVFIGGFEHTPNIDAAIRLVRRVMPFVWQTHPDVPVRIVGPCAPPEVEVLASRRVDVAGWMPQVDSLLDGAVAMVAPLSYGAGLKGKVTQALAAGLPVVTTSIGAEGLEDVAERALLCADDDEAIAVHIGQVLDDAELWQRLSAGGQAVAAERFSAEVMRRAMADALELADDLRAVGPPVLDVTP